MGKVVRGVVKGQEVREPQLAVARSFRRRQTAAEAVLWQHLRSGRLNGLHFRRQQPIGPYIVDFFCADSKLVVEVDGPIHASQAEYDQDRDAYLTAHGLRVLRFANDDIVHALDYVLSVIREAAVLQY